MYLPIYALARPSARPPARALSTRNRTYEFANNRKICRVLKRHAIYYAESHNLHFTNSVMKSIFAKYKLLFTTNPRNSVS